MRGPSLVSGSFLLSISILVLRNLWTPWWYVQERILRRKTVEHVKQSAESLRKGPPLANNGTLGIRSIPIQNITLATREKTSCLNPKLPTPTILMSLGRSGSSSTWETLSELAGKKSKAIELVGQDSNEIIDYFADPKRQNKGRWCVKHMCRLQRQLNSKRGIVGFKWKSFWESFDGNTHAEETFQEIARLAKEAQSKGKLPPIRVVRSRRNPLDVFISRIKHDPTKENRPPAHCHKDDKAEQYQNCLQAHKRKQTIPKKEVYAILKKLIREEDQVDAQLEAWGVPIVKVSYDKLYFPETPQDGEAEWNNMLYFLRQPQYKAVNHTWTQIQKKMEHASTSSRKHEDTIENYAQVRAALINTDLAYLLR